MGCACTKNSNGIKPYLQSSPGKLKSKINNVEGPSNNDGFENYDRIIIKPFSQKQNFLYHISPHNWLKIIDFLKFKELVEAGKINRTMNYLVKNAKVLLKFFKNKQYSKNKLKSTYSSIKSHNSNMGSKVEGVNINFIQNATVLSFPSFQGNMENVSLYNQNAGEGSSASVGSGNKNFKRSTFKKFSNYSKSKYLNTINVNTLKSAGNSEHGEYNIINNTINNQTLNLYINPTHDNYLDCFTQNEIDWNLIKREMTITDNRSIISDQTPSFSSNNQDLSDSFYPMLSNYFVKNINSRSDRAKQFLTAGGVNHRSSSIYTPSNYQNTSPLKLKSNDNINIINNNSNGGPRSPTLSKAVVNIKSQFNKLNTIVEENKNTRWKR